MTVNLHCYYWYFVKLLLARLSSKENHTWANTLQIIYSTNLFILLWVNEYDKRPVKQIFPFRRTAEHPHFFGDLGMFIVTHFKTHSCPAMHIKNNLAYIRHMIRQNVQFDIKMYNGKLAEIETP